MAEIQIKGKQISELPARESLAGTEMIPVQDAGGSGHVTAAQVKAYAAPDLGDYLKKQDAADTYVAKEEGKRLMTEEEAEAIQQNKADIEELKYGSAAYCVGAWADGELSPESVETYGDRAFLNAWDFYLLDTTDNAGQTTTPVGKLMRGNLFRFADGSFAPTVGITEAQYNECMGNRLYDTQQATMILYEEGEYDAAAEWEADKALIQGGGSSRDLYWVDDALVVHKVSHKLRPWETTETKYTIGIGRGDTVYLLDNVKGASGKVWKGLFSKPQVWDGVDVSAYPLAPTAISPCPVCTVGGKTRSFFYLYEGETNCKSSAGQNGLCTLFQDGRTYPRVQDMQQVNNMNYARANNADTTLPYPFAEGGYHALNAYITAMEAYHGTKYLHNNAMFGSGISSNDACNNETNWLANGGVRYKPSDGDTWKYATWSAQGDIYYNSTGSRTTFSIMLNLEWPKEQCMESQVAASYASETGIAEGVEFSLYGATYWYKNVPGTAGLDGMDVKVFKKTATSFNAFNADGEAAGWDVEVVLRMSLIGGANLSGDVFAYWGGGYEQVGTCQFLQSDTRAGNKVDLYLQPDQKGWLRETAFSKNDLGTFDFETAYMHTATTENIGDGYALRRSPYSGWKTAKGGGLGTGECYHAHDNNYWSNVLKQRARLAARFRGLAYYGYCSPRYLLAYNAASYANRATTGSAQALIGGAAALQAQ